MNRSDTYRSLGFGVGAGLTMALALPGLHLWPLILAVPALFRRAVGERQGWAAFRAGWVAGLAQWLAAIPWIVIVLHRYGNLWLPVALLGWVLMSAILGLLWGLAAAATARVAPGRRLWAIPLFLTAVEIMQGWPPFIFPWNPAATVAAGSPWLMAPLPVTGAAGLSLLLFLAGGALDGLVSPGMRRRGMVHGVAVVLVFGSAAVVAPAFRPAGPPVTAAAVQPNVPLEVRWDEVNLAAIESRVWRLSAEAAAAAEWVVWPESAIPRAVERDPLYRRRIERFARSHDVWMVVGSIGFGSTGKEYYNSLHVVSPDGLTPWRYDKVHLVPFGEYVPVVGSLPFLAPLVREVGSFTPGRSTLPLPGPAGPTGMAICYEVAYPSLVAAATRQGAQVLVTITNDGWYGDSAAPRQHLALAVLRAAEARRYLVRAANTGISAVIDPGGRVLTRLGMNREGVITAEVRPGEGVTPAVAAGRTVRLLIVATAVGAILLAAWRRPGRARARDAAGRSSHA